MHAPPDLYQMLQSLADRVTVLEQNAVSSARGLVDPFVWIGLTVKQAKVCAILMGRNGYVSRSELMLGVYGKHSPTEDAIYELISHVRKKLGVALTASYGRGWMLTDLEKAAINRRLAIGRL